MREKWAFAARFWAVAFTMTWAAMLIVRFVGTRMLHMEWTADTLVRYVLVSSAVGEMITVVVVWIIYAAILTMTEQERPDAP